MFVGHLVELMHELARNVVDGRLSVRLFGVEKERDAALTRGRAQLARVRSGENRGFWWVVGGLSVG